MMYRTIFALALVSMVASKALDSKKVSGKVETKDILASSATWTYFTSYPACCPGLPNYDPAADTTECTQFNRCAHPGDFVALGQRDPDFVANHDLVSFYDRSDSKGKYFYNSYGDKMMTITATCNGVTQTFDAIVADTCGNADCNNCCDTQANAATGYLLSMEYNTVIRHFGSTDCANAVNTVSFSVDTGSALAIPNCGNGEGGACNTAQTCCSANGFCGSGLDYCGDGCQATYGSCAGAYSCGLINGASCGADSPCCSQYGYCAATEDACGTGCQGAYGSCDSQSSSNGVSAQFSFAMIFVFLPFLAGLLNF